jgi:hypothetical protein
VIEIMDGKLVHDGMVIGVVAEEEHTQDEGGWKVEPTITLNLGWCKMAGVHVRVLGDPVVDRKRGGIVLDR